MAACLRPVTATQPSCSLVVPYRSMWRLAPSALLAALPNIPQMPHESPRPDAESNLLPPVRAVSPKMHSTTLARPVEIAMAACCTSAPAVAPPMDIEPVKRGSMPKCSPTAR